MRDSLSKLVNQDMPVRLSFTLSKLAKNIQEEMKNFEEQRIKLVQKVGEKQEDDTYKVADNRMAEFNKELLDLLNIEIDVEGKIPISEIEKVDSIALSPQDVLSLEPLFDNHKETVSSASEEDDIQVTGIE